MKPFEFLLATILFASFSLAACGSAHHESATATTPSLRASSPSPAPQSSAPPSIAPSDGTLAGTIWDVTNARAIAETALVQTAVRARFVVLGEVHDSRVAHEHQAAMVRAVIAAGRHPAIVFEMIDSDRQRDIDRARAASPHDPDAIANAVDFAHSGWDWAFYRPIVEAALGGGLEIIGGNLPHAEARAIVNRGIAGLDAAVATRLGLTEVLPANVQRELREEMSESHCGMLPERFLDGMVLAQRARDGTMAERMIAAGSDGAILIAGAGHARTDRGVPAALHRLAPQASVVSVGFVEVSAGIDAPAAYAREHFHADRMPFDDAWFVPTVPRDEDVCAPLRGHAR